MPFYFIKNIHSFQDYFKALEDADEKVQLANQIYDLVSKIFVNFTYTFVF